MLRTELEGLEMNNKNCENCALYSPEKSGYCEFWRKEVPSNDFCIEYKNINTEFQKENE